MRAAQTAIENKKSESSSSGVALAAACERRGGTRAPRHALPLALRDPLPAKAVRARAAVRMGGCCAGAQCGLHTDEPTRVVVQYGAGTRVRLATRFRWRCEIQCQQRLCAQGLLCA